jgi:hypothetical protein
MDTQHSTSNIILNTIKATANFVLSFVALMGWLGLLVLCVACVLLYLNVLTVPM